MYQRLAPLLYPGVSSPCSVSGFSLVRLPAPSWDLRTSSPRFPKPPILLLLCLRMSPSCRFWALFWLPPCPFWMSPCAIARRPRTCVMRKSLTRFASSSSIDRNGAPRGGVIAEDVRIGEPEALADPSPVLRGIFFAPRRLAPISFVCFFFTILIFC